MDCVFCSLPSERFIDETRYSYVFRDGFPVTPLHTLIIPKRHLSDYFEEPRGAFRHSEPLIKA